MQSAGGGAIVNFSSVSYMMGNTGYVAYTTSNAGITGMTRSLAREFGPDNIRVNGLAPAVVKTDFARKLWEEPERAARIAAAYPLKRLGEPDDIAGAAVFLASRAGAWITGQTILIDGGWSAMD